MYFQNSDASSTILVGAVSIALLAFTMWTTLLSGDRRRYSGVNLQKFFPKETWKKLLTTPRVAKPTKNGSEGKGKRPLAPGDAV
jgi:hypothetical protein